MTTEGILTLDHTRLARMAADTETLMAGIREYPCDTPERENWWAKMLLSLIHI